MISIWAESLPEHPDENRSLHLRFYCWDDGEAYTHVNMQENAGYTVPGVLYINRNDAPIDISKIGTSDDRVRVFANWEPASCDQNETPSRVKGEWKAQGFVRRNNRWRKMPVQIIPLQEDLFSRTRGIFETDVLKDVCVFTAGLGSVGSFVVEELAKQGIMNQVLLDHDFAELVNVSRQNVDISDVGRYKTKVAADAIHNKNPYANVETHEVEISWDMEDLVRNLVRKSDLVIGSVDNREAREILNKICVEEGKPLILMGAFHRAYGAQILFTRKPRIDPCYACFLMSLSENEDQWMSSLGRGEPHPYADHAVQNIEPGLSVDIAEMNVMTVRLCINELLKNKPTTFQSLDEDLIAPFYRYLNRREPGTPFEKLEPLGFNAGNGKVHILSWQGLDLRRNRACPVCGDYVGEMSKIHGISISPEDIEKYR